MSTIDGMGPGTPTPVTFTPRPKGEGNPLTYQAKGNQVSADVGKGVPGTNNNASFTPRPPVRPPGVQGLGEKGSFVDAEA